MALPVNLMEYLRSRTQVDCDCLDIQVASDLGPFVDCTSNQADGYSEFLNPQRAPLLDESIALARQMQFEYPGVNIEELAVEISLIKVSLTMAPLITGTIHVMANPTLSYSTKRIVEAGQRLYGLCRRLETGFDISRLCIKIPATWEGLLACRVLQDFGIKTLATTVHTIEQAILAAEVGCVYVSPFVHELRVFFDETYQDKDPIFDLCIKAQRYFEHFSYATRVKACCLISVDEVMQLTGVNALTIGPTLLDALSRTTELEADLASRSLFKDQYHCKAVIERISYVDDETNFREKYAVSDEGKGRIKTEKAIDLFCEYQTKAEVIMTNLMVG